MNFIYGPVPSRRLGRSLGIDLVPFKTCTYDCIYCQLGRTTNKTLDRKEWVPLDGICEQLDSKISSEPDYITLSGCGDPTLYSRIGEVIQCVKSRTKIPVVVLTNGGLLWQPEIQEELREADLVIPTLAAGDSGMFQAVNRPHQEITFERMLNGLIDFRKSYSGKIWLEVFLLAGHTAIEAEVRKMAQCVERIQPDRVQLNTVTRPPSESYAASVSQECLEKFSDWFEPQGEPIAEFRNCCKQAEFKADRNEILDMLRRRPCSVEDISNGLGLNHNEVLKHIVNLIHEDLLTHTVTEGRLFYQTVNLSNQH